MDRAGFCLFQWERLSEIFAAGRTSPSQVDILVTTGAEGNQIFLGIVSQPTPRIDMVNLKFSGTPASLAAPPIPLKHPLVELPVRLWL